MPRDSNGNFTLYTPGNPVVSGTTVASTWANNTLNDIATEMTDSLSRSGKGGMIAAFKFADGTVSAPGMEWTSETNSGFFRAAAGDMRAAVLAANIARFHSANFFQVSTDNGATWRTPVFLTTNAGTQNVTDVLQVSGVKVGVPQATLSTASGQLNLGATSFTDITNMTITLTTTGRPLVMGTVSDGSGSAGKYLVQSADVSLNAIFTFRILQDGAEIAQTEIEGVKNVNLEWSASTVWHLVTGVSAGSHTFKMQYKTNNGGASPTLGFWNMKFFVYEVS